MPPKKRIDRGRDGGRGNPAESSRLRARARAPSPDRAVDSPSVYGSSPEPESEPAAPATPRPAPGPPADGSGAVDGGASATPRSNTRHQGGARAARAWEFTDVPLSQDQRARNGRVAGRTLISWGRPRMAEKLLLNMQYELVQAGMEIPLDRIAHRLRPGASGSAVSQFLSRTRERLVAEGHLVPPIPGSVFKREVRGYVRRNPESDDLRSTRPVTFAEPLEDRMVSLPDAVNLSTTRPKRARGATRDSDEEGAGKEEEDDLAGARYTDVQTGSPWRDLNQSDEDDEQSDVFMEDTPSRGPRANSTKRAHRHRGAHGPIPRVRDPEFWQANTVRNRRDYPPTEEEQEEQDAAFNWRRPSNPPVYPGEARPPPPGRDNQPPQQMVPDRIPAMRAAPPPPVLGYDGYRPSENTGRLPFNPAYGADPGYTSQVNYGGAYNHGYWGGPMPPHPAATSPHRPDYPQYPYQPAPAPYEQHGYGSRDQHFQDPRHDQPPHQRFYGNPVHDEYGSWPNQPAYPNLQDNNHGDIYRHHGGGPLGTAFNPPAPRYPTEESHGGPLGGGDHRQPPPAAHGHPPRQNLPILPPTDDESVQAQVNSESEWQPDPDSEDAGGDDGGDGGGGGSARAGGVKYKREDSA
ncbi:uncharacterized protein B0H64DRAFT_476844 [Chaetomium fimeti]|uniref:Uncharacterized protein n=1 Tax=Chaetomium fimeti TaxID=1854472 RepID=A0AAE0HCW0_9PEZI|nr:hypothetical protein B0H64DRAFT_476844 [Chaetomium fimeti]